MRGLNSFFLFPPRIVECDFSLHSADMKPVGAAIRNFFEVKSDRRRSGSSLGAYVICHPYIRIYYIITLLPSLVYSFLFDTFLSYANPT